MEDKSAKLIRLTAGLGPALRQWQRLAAVWGAGLLAGLLPALRAYRYSLSDGMSIRI